MAESARSSAMDRYRAQNRHDAKLAGNLAPAENLDRAPHAACTSAKGGSSQYCFFNHLRLWPGPGALWLCQRAWPRRRLGVLQR